METERIALRQRERDRLRVLHEIRQKQITQHGLGDGRERYVNRVLREAFGQAKCIRTLKSLSASWRVADPGRSAI